MAFQARSAILFLGLSSKKVIFSHNRFKNNNQWPH
jgi:hypothetical protein